MIRVILRGHLGNQLFQYAFGLALASKLSTTVAFEKGDYVDEVKNQFEIDKHFKSYISSKYENRIFGFLLKMGLASEIFENQLLFTDFHSNYSRYHGFFQNEAYFKTINEQILEGFLPHIRYISEFKASKWSKINFENTIVISLRLGDYATWHIKEIGSKNLVLPSGYYDKALTKIPDWRNKKIIVVSDSPEDVKSYFSYLENIEIVESGVMLHFQIMLEAKWLILSNSTFAWWGGWLNQRAHMIMAPAFWLGFKTQREFPNGILASKFHQISTY